MELQRLLHEGKSGLFVTGLGDMALEHVSLLVDRAPRLMHPVIDLHILIVEVLFSLLAAFHLIHSLPPDITR